MVGPKPSSGPLQSPPPGRIIVPCRPGRFPLTPSPLPSGGGEGRGESAARGEPMRSRYWPAGLALAAAVAVIPALLPEARSDGGVDGEQVTWKKTVIDKKFRSEGVAVADVNKDGKVDILVGDVWYEAPDWKMHEIRKPGNYGDGANGYSHSFACWADDFNGDGWPDLVVIDFP